MKNKVHPFKILNPSRGSLKIDKNRLREEVVPGTEQFLEEGGRIVKLPASPSPKIPTVGMKGSLWEDGAGFGSLYNECGDDLLLDNLDEVDLMFGHL